MVPEFSLTLILFEVQDTFKHFNPLFDFYLFLNNVMPADGKFGDLFFPELLEVVVAVSRAAFNRVLSKQSLAAQQSGNLSEFSASLSRSSSDVTGDSGEGLQVWHFLSMVI